MKFEHKINNSYSYDAYIQLIDGLLANNKTTGSDQSESRVAYTQLNRQRIKRLDKKAELLPELLDKLEEVEGKQRWIVLTEAWCGDAAQIVPLLAKIADASDRISLELILRDDNLEIMDEFLTNGGRSIPKLIALDENDNILFTWGPRPDKAQQILYDHKNNIGGKTMEDFPQNLHGWYAKDKTKSIQQEFVKML
jgi:hypothetical protein